jgi:Icc protein
MAAEVSTVADDEVVVFDGFDVRRYEALAPGSELELDGVRVRTLPRPGGELLCRFATVNDLHFGEVECGVIDGMEAEGVQRADPGQPPDPAAVRAAAAAEIEAIDPVAVIAKGDLTTVGARSEYDAFLATYGSRFGSRLHHVLGNHDAPLLHDDPMDAAAGPQLVEVPGARVALLDTVIPGSSSGQVSAEQLEWLDDVAASAGHDGVPVLVAGHHHAWDPGSASRPAAYFGILPDDSERLVEVVARRPAIVGYVAGHTHRNRVRRFAATGAVPWVEVACVKDFPGTWAEYRVFEGGIMQVHRRLSSPAALQWSERCRALFGGAYPAYAFGGLDDRCFVMAGAP